MPAQTNTKKAILFWPVSSSQKITGTDMMRPSVMKFGMLMFKVDRALVPDGEIEPAIAGRPARVRRR